MMSLSCSAPRLGYGSSGTSVRTGGGGFVRTRPGGGGTFWAINEFKPKYDELRREFGNDYERIVSAIVSPGETGFEQEMYRRVRLAVASLMNSEGFPVPYPKSAVFPRPKRAQDISQPWLRALLTGHI